jgi:hypothetical protein
MQIGLINRKEQKHKNIVPLDGFEFTFLVFERLETARALDVTTVIGFGNSVLYTYSSNL